ncbi:hypothetical protein KC19_5G146200 [Ceratodon purpureus]|uniref:Serine aminopeptidase S33 domain-containing protein n=1 Tax=Ceratodon purpureus TaxID=3225 RepID=A0A8T0I2F1_CERPU|nr:hypothetical protein KC19_5G146200 [Ceratodon purpureus]
MSLMAAPRSLYVGSTAGESGMEKHAQAGGAPVGYYFSPFTLGSFPLRALRRLAMAFNSLSAMAPASFRFSASRMAKQKKGEAGEGKSGSSQPRLPLLWFPRFGRSVKEINEVQKRRKLATERFSDDGETGRKVVSFVNSRGQTLFSQSWTRVQELRALVIVLHGLNEHSGRYAEFAMHLNDQGYGVFGMDWIGHGGSDGLHGYVESLDHVVSDTIEFLQRVRAEHPGLPCFIYGHSTGGAIAVKAASQPEVLELLEGGIILTSPAVKVKAAHPVIGAVAPLFSVLLPRYQFQGVNRKLAVCRDPAALVTKYTDPLVYTGNIRVRTGTEILRLSSYLLKNLKSVKIPFLVLHGSDDQVTDPTGSQDLYDQASSSHKDIKLYQGLLHDILFEPERIEIIGDILEWMDNRLARINAGEKATADV